METTVKPSSNSGDPLLDEVRAVKQAVSARAGHDVAKLCRELRLEQAQSSRRVVHRTQSAERGGG